MRDAHPTIRQHPVVRGAHPTVYAHSGRARSA